MAHDDKKMEIHVQCNDNNDAKRIYFQEFDGNCRRNATISTQLTSVVWVELFTRVDDATIGTISRIANMNGSQKLLALMWSAVEQLINSTVAGFAIQCEQRRRQQQKKR